MRQQNHGNTETQAQEAQMLTLLVAATLAMLAPIFVGAVCARAL